MRTPTTNSGTVTVSLALQSPVQRCADAAVGAKHNAAMAIQHRERRSEMAATTARLKLASLVCIPLRSSSFGGLGARGILLRPSGFVGRVGTGIGGLTSPISLAPQCSQPITDLRPADFGIRDFR